MTDNIKKIFLDTSFFIRLMNQDDPHHKNALIYYRRFRDNKSQFYLSTIVAAEYGIGADVQLLPYNDLKVLPFNMDHAEKTSSLAKVAFEAKRKGAVALENRVVIPNDTKLLAQAQEVEVDLFIARDSNCEKVYEFMKNEGLLTFQYLDLSISPKQYFNELF